MANGNADETITIEHLVNTMEHIEEWVRLVKQALLTMDQQGRVHIEGIDLRRGSVRERGQSCVNIVAPSDWRAADRP